MVWIVEWFLFLLGSSFLSRYLIDIVYFILAFKFPKQVIHNKGTWALITASTDGIGLAFAEELAKKGYNIVQLSRNMEKMKSVSAKLQSKYKVQTKEIVFPFDKVSSNFSNSYKFLQDSLKDGPDKLNIEFIINNIGVGSYGIRDNLNTILDALSINIWPMTLISKFILDNYASNMKNTKFINLSSYVAVTGLGQNITYIYGSTKSFNLVFTEVLISENINAMAFTPGWVDTPLTRPVAEFRTMVITQEECAREGFKQFGTLPVTYGHIKHWIDAWRYRFCNIRRALLRLD